jgi:hypothetical protein
MLRSFYRQSVEYLTYLLAKRIERHDREHAPRPNKDDEGTQDKKETARCGRPAQKSIAIERWERKFSFGLERSPIENGPFTIFDICGSLEPCGGRLRSRPRTPRVAVGYTVHDVET